MSKYTTFDRTVLPNGIRVISESISNVHSLSIGIFIKVGSRDEPEHLSGIAHFLEHMAFKGTKTKSPKQISKLIEGGGGILNAFTSREVTGYYATVLPSEFKTALDVLTDILSNSIYPEIELVKEKEIILDELRGMLETPDDFIFEKWQEQVFPKHSLGRSILGTFETLQRIKRDDLIKFIQIHYHPINVTVAAAGNIIHKKLCDCVENKLILNSTPNTVSISDPVPLQQEHKQTIKFPSENAHLVLGTRAFAYNDKRKIPLMLLNTVLGNGMSSRLFQEIREKRGIAYSVYSFVDNYRDTGVFGIYLGTDEKKIDKACELAKKELFKLVNNPLKPNELKRIKKQVKGNLVLALESTSSRMSRIARMELYSQNYLSIDELKEKIDNTTAEEIQSVAVELWSSQNFIETRLIPDENNEKRSNFD
ncbi:MAG: insulinase family protein [bacterium]|nr:insulinase family protein [bacterium]